MPRSPKFYQLISRDHNTKRAKLSLDVCAMFVAAKAIFSNFAIARARLSNKRNLKVERKRSRPRARQKSNSIVRVHARAMAKLLKIALAATSIAQTSILSFALLLLWSLVDIYLSTRMHSVLARYENQGHRAWTSYCHALPVPLAISCLAWIAKKKHK